MANSRNSREKNTQSSRERNSQSSRERNSQSSRENNRQSTRQQREKDNCEFSEEYGYQNEPETKNRRKVQRRRSSK